jgi:serralysin
MSNGTYAQWLSALGQNESGNNYSFVSSLGYLGRFQFGEEALETVGFYGGHDGTGAIDFVGGWTSQAAGYGVSDKAGFLGSPAAQDAAADAWFAKVWTDVKSLGLDAYVGQTVGGVAISVSGLIAGGHLVGVWALKDFLTSGGADLPRDGYGTSVAEYVDRFGGFDTPYGGAPGGPPGGGGGGDTQTGTEATDYLRGGAGADLLSGGGGFDDLNGNTGDDTVRGGAGDDWVVGGQDQDALSGDAGNDIVLGNLGNDSLDGGEGADIVRGGKGDDSVAGGGGGDWLSGDLGTDVLAGGGGADVFHFFAEAGNDRVVDFHPWEGDRVDVLENTWSVAQVGADVVVTVGGGHLTLEGVQLSSLPDGWIV